MSSTNKRACYEKLTASEKDIFAAHVWYLMGFASGQIADIGGNTPLCSVFFDDMDDSCTFCPVQQYTGRYMCEGTPYDNTKFTLVETREQAVKAANLLEFFVEFLPTDHMLLVTARGVVAAIKNAQGKGETHDTFSS